MTLTDAKGRKHSVLLAEGGVFHTSKGGIAHDDLLGGPEGVVVHSHGGTAYLALRPLLADVTVAMPRGAAVVYPKDAAQIVGGADVFPGARVIEAGVGSGALTISLLRAHRADRPADLVRAPGRLRRHRAHRTWRTSSAGPIPAGTCGWATWSSGWPPIRPVRSTGSSSTCSRRGTASTRPPRCWCPGGVLCAYVATTTQLARTVETIRIHTGFTEPEATESLVRGWQAEGLAVRPQHAMVGHTGFLIFARRLAPGVVAPARRRRPAPGAYGEDYTGPRGDRG